MEEVIFDGDTLVETREITYTQDGVRMQRDSELLDSDLWMLADRYANLTEEQQTELIDYRQALRDITSYFDDDDLQQILGANDAMQNFPIQPDWMVI